MAHRDLVHLISAAQHKAIAIAKDRSNGAPARTLKAQLRLCRGYTLWPSSAYRSGTVAQVRNGDALVLQDGQVVRLVGIDAPKGEDPFSDQARAALGGQSHVVVVHGHGTGALRKRVRAYLDESPYVARWAPGTSRQGGDGVSIVELR